MNRRTKRTTHTLSRSILRCSLIRALIALAPVLTIACGGGESISGPPPPASLDVSGTWDFHEAKSGGGSSLVVTSTLELNQSGTRISGSHRDTRSLSNTCVPGGCFTEEEFVPDGPVTGTISGSAIVLEFSIDNSGGVERLEGTVNGSAMSGPYWSAERSAPPDPPTGLRAEALSSTQIGLSWTDNSDNETGFRVEIRCCSESFHELGVTGENETAGVAGGLTPSTTFEFRVQAIGAAGASEYSNVASATTYAGATPTGRP